MWPEISLERFFDKFVVGGMVFLGAWYLHRPFLLEYFPNVAGDSSAQGFESEFAILLFVVGAVALGVLISHVADIAVVACFEDAGAGKSERRYRQRFRALCRPFTIRVCPDPRQQAIERYLHSPRRNEFSALLNEWGLSSPAGAVDPAEAAIAHQHIVGRLSASGEAGRQAAAESAEPVAFAASIFIALVGLVVVGLLSFVSTLAVTKHAVLPVAARIVILLVLYIAAVIAGISLRRRVRHFSSSILTTALHHFKALNASSNEKWAPHAKPNTARLQQ